MLGLSAGAFIAADLATRSEESRSDFVGKLYGGLRNSVPADTPPAFIAAAANDELFDLRPKGTTSDGWFDQFVSWMSARGLLDPMNPNPVTSDEGL